MSQLAPNISLSICYQIIELTLSPNSPRLQDILIEQVDLVPGPLPLRLGWTPTSCSVWSHTVSVPEPPHSDRFGRRSLQVEAALVLQVI